MKKLLYLIIILALIFGGYYVWQKNGNEPKTDSDLAREVLVNYFNSLNKREYAKAVKYYGGSYDTLRSWNPDIDPQDFSSLFKNGCESNGLNCLVVKNILDEQETKNGEFNFVVQFAEAGGTLFQASYPDGTHKTDFKYIVKKSGTDFLVMGRPPYQE